MKMKQIMGLISGLGIAALLSAILLCGFCFWLPQWLNNLTLQHFAENLYEYPLPPNTIVVNKSSDLQKVGNGNNCYYIASETLVSSLPREEIENYYKDVSLPVVDKNRIDELREIPVRLEFKDETLTGKIYFRLLLIDTGSHTTLDIRCH